MGDYHRVLVTGGTGYIGSRLIAQLLQKRHRVRAVVRPGSENRLPPGCSIIYGDALNADSYAAAIAGCDTFVHLVGVPHPSPAKAKEFVAIDQRSAMEAIRVAAQTGIQHFVYLSVAHPAPLMRAYVEARSACEAKLLASGLPATILRPWYVLGPGHRWPYVLTPFYWIAERIPATRDSARRLGLVTRDQMLSALTAAVENPARGVRVVEVPEIQSAPAHA
jgi:uncharacterized protein YbjT (DUF2867 family)